MLPAEITEAVQGVTLDNLVHSQQASLEGSYSFVQVASLKLSLLLLNGPSTCRYVSCVSLRED
jgi:hypothetical protein